MNTYTYTNYKTGHKRSIVADSILEADGVYQTLTGIDLIKSPFVGCSIQFNTERIQIFEPSDKV